MKHTTNKRVLAFIEYVEETQPQAVANFFLNRIHECDDPSTLNLNAMLEEAKDKNPDAAKLRKIEESVLNSVLRHCKS